MSLMDEARDALTDETSAPCVDGDSGANCAGINLATDYIPAHLIRKVTVEGSGNLCFETPMGGAARPHIIQMTPGLANSLSGVLISKIYGAGRNEYPTTVTGVHVFFSG